MDEATAKAILMRLRPSEWANPSPEQREAMEFARHHPSLSQWLEPFQASVPDLCHTQSHPKTPDCLCGRIMNLKGSVRCTGLPLPFLARAFLFALLLGGMFLIPILNHSRELPLAYEHVPEALVSALLQMESFDMRHTNIVELAQWLKQKGPFDPGLPPQSSRGLGCRWLVWQGCPVALVCLHPEGETSPASHHYFVMRRSDLPETPPLLPPTAVMAHGMHTLRWTDANRIYMLASRAPLKPLPTTPTQKRL